MERSFAGLTAALLLVTLVAGCLGDPARSDPNVTGEPEDVDRGPEAFWFVWVQGNETHDPPPRYACSIAFDHDVKPGTREIRYSNHTYNITDPVFVIAFDHWEQGSSCPLAYKLHVGLNATTVEMGRYGDLTFTPREDGSLVLESGSMERELVPGRSATFDYSDRYASREGGYVDANGTFTIEHHGVWPVQGLTPTSR